MDRCRNNVGAWPTKQISRPGGIRDFAYYAAKDKAMGDDAKCGMMLWDGESKGTLNNIQNLIAAGKNALVYFSPEKAFYKLASAADLQALMGRCDQVHIALRAAPNREGQPGSATSVARLDSSGHRILASTQLTIAAEPLMAKKSAGISGSTKALTVPEDPVRIAKAWPDRSAGLQWQSRKLEQDGQT